MNALVIAGIGTGIGKTFISAILTEGLEADYWKPIQAGNLEKTDTDLVKNWISNPKSVMHPESYKLSKPMSPHAAAKIDGIQIEIEQLVIPKTSNKLIIELAGGIMVPLNERILNIDLLKHWNLPVILVSMNYLGSINHTLLSYAALKASGILIAGIIFNGKTNESTEDFLLDFTKLDCIAHIGEENEINKSVVLKHALKISKKIKSL